MFNITRNDLKNIIRIAEAKSEKESIYFKRSNDYKSFEIKIEYEPVKNVNEDIYPYWIIKTIQDETESKIYLNSENIKEVQNIAKEFFNLISNNIPCRY